MEEFIWSLPEGSIQNTLERAIQGRGAFRRFKDLVDDLGVEKNGLLIKRKSTRKL